MESFASFTVNYFALCSALAAYRGKINRKKYLREFGLLAGSRFLAWDLARVIHFLPPPATGKLLRAKLATRHPQKPPARHGSPPATRHLGKLAGLRASKLTDAARLAVIAKQPRTNSTIRHNPYCANHASRPTFALKKPQGRPTGKRGGGGAPGRALFSYNS